MEDSDLLAVYRDYLACLNARRWDELGRFVVDEVLYNGDRPGISGYRAMLVADTNAIPDLQFIPEILIADDQVVSCRLFFQCTPQQEFLGFEPTGGRLSFPEQVFYRFDNRQIGSLVGDRQGDHSPTDSSGVVGADGDAVEFR